MNDEDVVNEDNFDNKKKRRRVPKGAAEAFEVLRLQILFIHQHFGVNILRKTRLSQTLFMEVLNEMYTEIEKNVITFVGFKNRVVFEDGELFYAVELARELRMVLEDYNIGTPEEIGFLKKFEVDEAEYQEEKKNEGRRDLVWKKRMYFEELKKKIELEDKERRKGIIPVLSYYLDYLLKNKLDTFYNVVSYSYKATSSVTQLGLLFFEKELEKIRSSTIALGKASKEFWSDPNDFVYDRFNSTIGSQATWVLGKGYNFTTAAFRTPYDLYNYFKYRPYFGPENAPYYGPARETPEEKEAREKFEKDAKIAEKIVNDFVKEKEKIKKTIVTGGEKVASYVNSLTPIKNIVSLGEGIKDSTTYVVNSITIILVLLIIYNIVS